MPGFQLKEPEPTDDFDDEDLDDMMDQEEESIMRQMAEARIAEIRARAEDD